MFYYAQLAIWVGTECRHLCLLGGGIRIDENLGLEDKKAMKLSGRMEAVAAMVSPVGILADIGTDHGYVPVALVERGIAGRAIAADVRPGPLSRAQQTIARAGLGQQISTRLSDGLCAFAPGEMDAIVIAGMGGALVIRILKDGRRVAHSANQIVLQPQSEIAGVRRFLMQDGYVILDEEMVCEDGKYYTVIKACDAAGISCSLPENRAVSRMVSNPNVLNRIEEEPKAETLSDTCTIESYSEVEYAYGRILLRKSHPVLLQYLEKEARQLQKILTGIPADGKSPQALQRREEILHQLELNQLAMASFC